MDDIQRFKKIEEDIKNLSDRKIRIEERFEGQKKTLEALLTEIKAKGYDPKNISETRKEKEAEKEKLMLEIETLVKEVDEKLKTMEN